MDMWMMLLVRMVTRAVKPPSSLSGEGEDDTDAAAADAKDGMEVVDARTEDFYERQDRLRQTLCDYIMADFPSR